MTAPRRISLAAWQRRFLDLDPEEVREVRYLRHLGDHDWARYLKPPSAWLPYGMRRLARLHYDDDVRALRLWGFALEESERLFRARRAGMRIVALMGDYGALAPLVHAFPDTVTFYPDYAYFTPFLMESDVLLERAARRGLGDDTCFVRAAVGAFTSRAWWPEPDLVVASTGASCDDLAAVIQVAADAGNRVDYLDIPLRKEPAPWLKVTRFRSDDGLPEGAPPRPEGILDPLVASWRDLLARLAAALETPLDPARLEASVARARRVRALIGEIRDAVAAAPLCPLPASEALLVEFSAPHSYGDPEECLLVLEGVRDLVRSRAEAGTGFGRPDDVRLVWGTPPPDPLLHVHVESAGGRVVGSEYLIASALTPIPEGEPVEAVARAFLAGSLLGSSAARARAVTEEVRRTRAEGVVLSNLFGSSHCGAETPWIRDAVEERCGVPVLAFDVPRPAAGGIGSQVRNRIDAFLEALRRRRARDAG